MTTGRSDGASSRSLEGLSWLESFVTTTIRASPGIEGRTADARPFQNPSQDRHPLDRNARSVGVRAPRTATFMGSPASVVPTTSNAGVAASRAGGRWSGIPRRGGASAGARAEAGTSSSSRTARRRRISAWLRSRPATSSAINASRSVSTVTMIAMGPPRPLEAGRLVAADRVLDDLRAAAVHEDRAGRHARDHAAHDLRHALDLRVALAVAEHVAARGPVAAVVVRAVTPADAGGTR